MRIRSSVSRISVLLFALQCFVVSKAVHAQSATTGSSDIDSMLTTVINVLTAVAGLAIVVSIIFAGIQYMTAGGNSNQVSAAKNRIVVSVAMIFLLAFGFGFLQWLVPGGIFN